MLGSVANRRLFEPRSLRDALRMLDAEGPLVPMAGCTDLYVALNFGTLDGTKFLNLWELDELRRIAVRGDVLSIGALCTYTAIIKSRVVQTRVPMLTAASRQIGGVQIQNRGTIGGNIANASPAGDTLPVLAAADAIVVVKSSARERRIPLTDFYAGYPEWKSLTGLYRRFSGKPFAITEWALESSDDPAFVSKLFAWVRSHPRTKMLVYYQDFGSTSSYRIQNYSSALNVLRARLHSGRFPDYAPGAPQLPPPPPGGVGAP